MAPSRHSPNPIGGGGARQAAASRWLARRDRGLVPEEAREFAAWLEDPRNREALESLDGPFHALDRARVLVPNGEFEADPDFLLGGRSGGARRVRWVRLLTAGAAAAALVFGLLTLRSRELLPFRTKPVVIDAGRAGQHPAVLPDGSRVELGADARIAVAYKAGERRVLLLNGEAHFTVSKDPVRPFVVEAGRVEVRAVGTAFAVDHAPDCVEIVVTEGRVRVDDSTQGVSLLKGGTPGAGASDPAGFPVLIAGQRVIIPASNGLPAAARPTAASDAELEHARTWTARWLQFDEKPLSEVAAEFDRYGDRTLRIADDTTGRILVTGTFRADGEEAFVRLLESSFGVSVSSQADGAYLLQKRP